MTGNENRFSSISEAEFDSRREVVVFWLTSKIGSELKMGRLFVETREEDIFKQKSPNGETSQI